MTDKYDFSDFDEKKDEYDFSDLNETTKTVAEHPSSDGWKDETDNLGIAPIVEEPSQLEAGLRGVGQGVTFGLSDEILGAGQALYDRTLGDSKDLLESYRTRRDEQRAAEKAAEKAHGGLYLTGEIGGGLIPALLTGGGSEIASLGKVGLGQLIKRGAITGAEYGAGQALGKSEADLTTGDIENYKQAAKDVTMGAGTGAVIGAALPVAGKGIKKAIDVSGFDPSLAKSVLKKAIPQQIKAPAEKLLDTFETLRRSADRYRRAKAGEAVSGKKAFDTHIEDLNNNAKQLVNLVKNETKKANKDITEGLAESKMSPKKLVNLIDDSIEEMKVVGVDEDSLKIIKDLESQSNKLKESMLKEGYTSDEFNKLTKEEAIKKLNLKRDEDQLIRKNIATKAPNKEGEIETLSKDALTPKDIGVIEELESPMGRNFVRYSNGNRKIKEEIQSLDFLDQDKLVDVQKLFNFQKSISDYVAQKGNAGALTPKLNSLLKNMKKEVLKGLNEADSQKVKKAFQKWSDAHSFEYHAPSGVLSKNEDEVLQSVGDIKDKFKNIHGFNTEQSLKDQDATRNMLEAARRLNGKGVTSIQEKAVDTAKKIELAKKSNPSSSSLMNLVTSGMEHVAGATGAGMGVVTRLASSTSNGLRTLASKSINPKTANFLRNLATVDEKRRAALLFSASQNTDTRKELQRLIDNEDNES